MSLRDHLSAIYETHGLLTPKVVVNEARSPSHPLHDRFEWDDSVAGEKYREQQAAELIRSVKVVWRDKEPGTAPVRAFVHMERADGNTYVPIEQVAQDDISTAILLRQAEREWKQMLRRYEGLAGFLEMIRGDVHHKAS